MATPELTVLNDNVPGIILGSFKKAQYLGESNQMLTKKDPTERMQEIHTVANKAMHEVHKASKHRTLGYAKCYVTTEGVYLYESKEKEDKHVLKWNRKAKEIYCVVMGKRTILTHNQMATLMMFDIKEGEKPSLPCSMSCVVVEFHHDHKNRAAQFHKSCENMMKNLLSAEMSKLTTEESKEKEATDENVDGAVTEQSNYFEVPEPDSDNKDGDDSNDGVVDGYEHFDQVGKKARGSIISFEESGSDYLTVIVADRPSTTGSGTQNLSSMLSEEDDDDEL